MDGRLKNRLVQEWLAEMPHPEFSLRCRRAANEAATLARRTPYPLLLFPTLFTERTCLAASRLWWAEGDSRNVKCADRES